MEYNGGEFSNSDLFSEIKEIAIREGVNNIVQYKDLVDDLVEEKRLYGFFSDDEDLEQIQKDLILRWNELEESLGIQET